MAVYAWLVVFVPVTLSILWLVGFGVGYLRAARRARGVR